MSNHKYSRWALLFQEMEVVSKIKRKPGLQPGFGSNLVLYGLGGVGLAV